MQRFLSGTRLCAEVLRIADGMVDYLSAFGTQGARATGGGLTGLSAGMVVGQVGKTGCSFGEHLDWLWDLEVVS